jgi:CRP/FNR family cyclic AMP-dependent transcriptional regulator
MVDIRTAMAPVGDTLLPLDLREAFLARARNLKVRKSQIVIAEGTDSTDVYLVRSGKLRISLSAANGREILLRDIGPGALVGELAAIDGGLRSASVAALEEAELACQRAEDFIRFLGEVPQAGLWMTRQLAARVRDLTERTTELATLPIAGRVQRELLRLAAEAGGEGDQAIIRPMPTHAEIASRLGTHREAVTRELNQLAQEGIVRQAGRQTEILSVAKLYALYARIRC